MGRIRMSRDLAQRASWDAANNSMRLGGRKAWNEEDTLAADREFARLWPDCPHGLEPQNCSFCFTTLNEKGHKL